MSDNFNGVGNDSEIKRDIRYIDAIITLAVMLFGCGFGTLVSIFIFSIGAKYPVLYLAGFILLMFPMVYVVISSTRDILLSMGNHSRSEYDKHTIFKK